MCARTVPLVLFLVQALHFCSFTPFQTISQRFSTEGGCLSWVNLPMCPWFCHFFTLCPSMRPPRSSLHVSGFGCSCDQRKCQLELEAFSSSWLSCGCRCDEGCFVFSSGWSAGFQAMWERLKTRVLSFTRRNPRAQKVGKFAPSADGFHALPLPSWPRPPHQCCRAVRTHAPCAGRPAGGCSRVGGLGKRLSPASRRSQGLC